MIRVQMPRGTSSVSVGGETYTPDEDGIVKLKLPEHVAPLVASGGIELNEDGVPGQTSVLIGSDKFGADIDLGPGLGSISIGSLVADTQSKINVSDAEWNNLPQPVRDTLIGFNLQHRRGDMSIPDPRVPELQDRISELEGTIDTLNGMLSAAAQQAAPEVVAPGGGETVVERPDFENLTKAKINEWLVANGTEALTTGNHDAFVSAAAARWVELHPAEAAE